MSISKEEVEDDIERQIMFGAGWDEIKRERIEEKGNRNDIIINEPELKGKNPEDGWNQENGYAIEGSSTEYFSPETTPMEPELKSLSSEDEIDEEYPWGRPLESISMNSKAIHDESRIENFVLERPDHGLGCTKVDDRFEGFERTISSKPIIVEEQKSYFDPFPRPPPIISPRIFHLEKPKSTIEPSKGIPVPPMVPVKALSENVMKTDDQFSVKPPSEKEIEQNPLFKVITALKTDSILKANSVQKTDMTKKIDLVLKTDSILRPSPVMKSSPILSPKQDLTFLQEFDPLMNPRRPIPSKAKSEVPIAKVPIATIPVTSPVQRPPPGYSSESSILQPKQMHKK